VWLVTAFLFFLPVVTYWPATFHEYGLRDDYSNLRESHEELGKVVQFCASHARPARFTVGFCRRLTDKPRACTTCNGCACWPRSCSVRCVS
jgi:hypothetical protein